MVRINVHSWKCSKVNQVKWREFRFSSGDKLLYLGIEMHAVHESSSWPYTVEFGRSARGMNFTQNIQFWRMDENDFLRKTLN